LVSCSAELPDGLLVGDLGLADVGLDLELAQQPVHDYLQMKLAHAGDDGLAGLFVGVGLEGGILLGELLKGDAHLLLAGLGLGLDGHADDGLREFHGFEHDLDFSSHSVSPVVVFLRPTAAAMSPVHTDRGPPCGWRA
jgi:hypothetical protein